MPRVPRLSFDEFLRLIRALALVAAATLLMVHGAGAQGVGDPPAVIQAFEQARSDGNLEVALQQFSPGAVLKVDQGATRVFRGRDEIRGFLETLEPTSTLALTTGLHLDGQRVLWSEMVGAQSANPLALTGEATIADGKISTLTYRAGTLVAPQGQTSASAGGHCSAVMVLGALALLGLGLVSLVSVRSRRPSDSAMRGRQISALRHVRWGRLAT